MDVRVPSIVLLKRNDPLQSKVVFEGEYAEEAIVRFVKYSSLPKYVRHQNYTLLYFRNVIPFFVSKNFLCIDCQNCYEITEQLKSSKGLRSKRRSSVCTSYKYSCLCLSHRPFKIATIKK